MRNAAKKAKGAPQVAAPSGSDEAELAAMRAEIAALRDQVDAARKERARAATPEQSVSIGGRRMAPLPPDGHASYGVIAGATAAIEDAAG